MPTRRFWPNRAPALWTVLLVLTAVACSTLHYRQIQSDFEQAVLADNAQLDPIIDRSDALYREVAAALTNERIAQLDPQLRANAWMIRAFSEWRSRQLARALASAERGRAAGPVAHSRDDVLLHLIPALVIDSEVMQAWLDAGQTTDPALYASTQETDFRTAVAKIDEARARLGPATPLSTRYYAAYQRWRVLQNWRGVIREIPDRPARKAARDRAQVGGKPLKEAAAAARDAIPANHFLALQIRAEGG